MNYTALRFGGKCEKDSSNDERNCVRILFKDNADKQFAYLERISRSEPSIYVTGNHSVYFQDTDGNDTTVENLADMTLLAEELTDYRYINGSSIHGSNSSNKALTACFEAANRLLYKFKSKNIEQYQYK